MWESYVPHWLSRYPFDLIFKQMTKCLILWKHFLINFAIHPSIKYPTLTRELNKHTSLVAEHSHEIIRTCKKCSKCCPYSPLLYLPCKRTSLSLKLKVCAFIIGLLFCVLAQTMNAQGHTQYHPLPCHYNTCHVQTTNMNNIWRPRAERTLSATNFETIRPRLHCPVDHLPHTQFHLFEHELFQSMHLSYRLAIFYAIHQPVFSSFEL